MNVGDAYVQALMGVAGEYRGRLGTQDLISGASVMIARMCPPHQERIQIEVDRSSFMSHPLQRFLGPGDGAIDVGANVGLVTRELAVAVGPSGRVVGIEPLPSSAETARQNCREHPQVVIQAVALGAVAGDRLLWQDTDCRRNSLWTENVAERTGDPVSVPVTTLDMIAKTVLLDRPLRAVKIDAQGAEVEILKGATETLHSETVKAWYVEIWREGLKHAGSSVEHLAYLFETAGWVPDGSSESHNLTTWEGVVKATDHHEGHASTDVLLVRR